MDLKNKILSTAAGIFLFTGIILPQEDKPFVSSGDLQFYLDKAVFAGNDSAAFCEFYLMFYAYDINFNKTLSKGTLDIAATISDISGTPVDERKWSIEIALKENEDSKTKVIYDQWNEYLSQGQYLLQLNVRDKNSGKRGELNLTMDIPVIPADGLALSDIEFVSSVDKSKIAEQFRKGDRSIVPNPSRRYGTLNPVLQFYYEIYGIKTKGEFNFKYNILKGDSLIEFKSIKNNVPEGKAAVLHGININNIISGVYELFVEVSDIGSGKVLTSSRKFEIIHYEIQDIKTMTEGDELKQETIIKYLAPGQIDNFTSLNHEGKQSFIIEFWKSMDPTPGTSENEFMKEIQQRFIYAEKNFSWAGIEGWKMDMGRICIKYGIPDEIMLYNSEAEYSPYQIWLYRENREYQFIFGDIQSNGRYVLIHSDREGEVSNIYWKEQLKKM